MTLEELKRKERVLRECFKEVLERLNVSGDNAIDTIRQIKNYGALWHYTHQLLLAEENDTNMNIKVSGNLKMLGGE